MIDKFLVKPESTLLDCLKVIDNAGTGIALAVDNRKKLIGTVSDGDIRRALIKGIPLSETVKSLINQSYFSVSPESPRIEVLDIMQARKFEQVPIIDDDGIVVGMHLLREILGESKDLPNIAVIMAGGKGTRLHPITNNIPKPMVKVAGRPILERIVLHLISHGITQIYISVNYLSKIIEDHFKDGSHLGCNIKYLKEDNFLGSGGSLSLLPEVKKHPILVMNGDLITDIDFNQLINAHVSEKYFATICAYSYLHKIPFGCIEQYNGELLNLEEKPLLEKNINAGIYVLSPKAVKTIPKDTFFPITEIFEYGLKHKQKCGVFMLENEWNDVGTVEELKSARKELF